MTPEEKKAKAREYASRPEVKERRRLASARYRAANPEKVVETNRKQYEKNAEELRIKALARYHADREARAVYRKSLYRKAREAALAYRRRYAEANAKAISEKAKIYRAANRERREDLRRQWRKRNPDAHRIHLHTRRARMTGGRLSANIVSKLMRLQKARCPECKVSLKKTGHHIDHVEPLAKGGANEDFNVQLLCPSCNCRKGHKDPIAWAQQEGRLL